MPESISISMRVPGTSPMPDILDMIRRIEAAGFDGAGILDSQMICRDTFVTLAMAAANTSTLKLFPAVTNPFGRIPPVLAGAAQTVAEIAPGRTRFIMGTGYTSASTIGRRPATLRQMRRCITEVRALLAGETVDYNGLTNPAGLRRKRMAVTACPSSWPPPVPVPWSWRERSPTEPWCWWDTPPG